jgi:DNA-binding NtrC family response regulator
MSGTPAKTEQASYWRRPLADVLAGLGTSSQGLIDDEAVARRQRLGPNVRQLRHAVERVVALHPGGPVGPVHLDHLKPEDAPGAAVDSVLAYEEERAQFERGYLQRLLKVANGNVSEAARISGIARQNLYPRLRRYDLS